VSRLHDNASKEEERRPQAPPLPAPTKSGKTFVRRPTTSTSRLQTNESHRQEGRRPRPGSMPCRPRGQRHASSTTLNPGAAAPASTRDRPAPPSNLPPSARHRNRRLSHQMPRRRAAILASWHTSATGLQVSAGASAPRLTCHPRWPSAAEPNSDRFWARALDPRPPRDLRAEEKLAAQTPPPPRPRGHRPGLQAPGELQPRAGPDRARPDPDRARTKHRAATTQRCRHRRPPHSPARRRRNSTTDANHRRAAAARGGADGSGAPASNAFTAALPQPPSVTGAAATAAGPAAAAEARRKPGGPAAARVRLPRVARCYQHDFSVNYMLSFLRR
jgi:hypothetical protein